MAAKTCGLLAMLIFLAFSACRSPEQLSPFRPVLPAHFPTWPEEQAHNPTSPAGIELGKALFFDPRLSANGRVSCGTCHQPALAFSDGTALAAHGASGRILERHAPALFNLAWHDSGLFWDGGAHDLASQAVAPLRHPDEMGQDLRKLPKILADIPEYPPRFRQVFGTDTLQLAHVLRALAQYQRSLISASAPYDRAQADPAYTLSPLAIQGAQVFEKHCATCHKPPLFTDLSFHNNGLDSTYDMSWEHVSQGRYRITLDSADLGKFKTPSLRNLAFTAPYMHDGRFADLDAVIAHYRKGIKTSARLSPLLISQGQAGLMFSDEEAEALKAFLATLNDSAFVSQTSMDATAHAVKRP